MIEGFRDTLWALGSGEINELSRELDRRDVIEKQILEDKRVNGTYQEYANYQEIYRIFNDSRNTIECTLLKRSTCFLWMFSLILPLGSYLFKRDAIETAMESIVSVGFLVSSLHSLSKYAGKVRQIQFSMHQGLPLPNLVEA